VTKILFYASFETVQLTKNVQDQLPCCKRLRLAPRCEQS